MALNISFNPIYDFDKGFDFTTFGCSTSKIYEPEVWTEFMESKKMHL